MKWIKKLFKWGKKAELLRDLLNQSKEAVDESQALVAEYQAAKKDGLSEKELDRLIKKLARVLMEVNDVQARIRMLL